MHSTNLSVQSQRRLANNNGQYGNIPVRPVSMTASGWGNNNAQATDSANCVRAPFNQYYSTETNCMESAPPNTNCNPRYINGVWPYYMPYAADSSSCGGGLPPDILPQTLDTNSVVQNDSWYSLDNVVLQLMVNNIIGQLAFTTTVDDVLHSYTLLFTQNDMIARDLFAPLIYRYSVLMPDIDPALNQRAILEINLSNGYVSVMFPMGNGSSLLKFIMTSIQSA